MSHERTTYYQRAITWAVDEQAALLDSLRRARIATGVIALIAILEAFALLALTPLKTVTMVPVLVDRQTGFVEALKPDGRQEIRADQALTQSLLAQYVVARESFDITSVAAEYHKVALWSADAARRDYLALMPASNPASPFRRYPRTALVDTAIKSVSPLGPQTALVRFETRRRDQDAQASSAREWAAVVRYRFSNEGLSVADRWLNPLGFQVVGYRVDSEAPLPSEPVGRPTPAVSAPDLALAPGGKVPPPAPPQPAATSRTTPSAGQAVPAGTDR